MKRATEREMFEAKWWSGKVNMTGDPCDTVLRIIDPPERHKPWFGIPGCYVLQSNTWFTSIIYNGFVFDLMDIENDLWDEYRGMCESDGTTETETGFDKTMWNPETVRGYMDECIASYEAEA